MKLLRSLLSHVEPVVIVAVLLLAVSITLGVAGFIRLHGAFNLDEFFRDYYANMSTEAASIAITVLVIDQLNRQQEARFEAKRLKARLIRDLGSVVNDVTKHAAEELSTLGWLEDGSLQGADFMAANLQEVNLAFARLHGANLEFARLHGAHLIGADLQEAVLLGARLQGADLRGTRLQGAILMGANLHGAALKGVRLQGADLRGANLEKALLDGAEFDENTVLPDGSHWAPETDLKRFTDPKHPAFWRSDHRASPAFRGKRP